MVNNSLLFQEFFPDLQVWVGCPTPLLPQLPSWDQIQWFLDVFICHSSYHRFYRPAFLKAWSVLVGCGLETCIFISWSGHCACSRTSTLDYDLEDRPSASLSLNPQACLSSWHIFVAQIFLLSLLFNGWDGIPFRNVRKAGVHVESSTVRATQMILDHFSLLFYK